MAVRKPPKAKKGKNPEQIPMNIQWIKSEIAANNVGLLERWKKAFHRWPTPLKEALKQEGITF
tara:strand:- start:1365 stop:1553 length:189 start_codon:yes stop_codon:yes gene_type:complete